MIPPQYYCTQCRAPMPEELSRTQGFCDGCKAEYKRAFDEANARAEANKQARYAADSHRGVCMACQSRNIGERWEPSGGNAFAYDLSRFGLGCFGLITLPLIVLLAPLIIITLPIAALCGIGVSVTKPTHILRRWCNACGHVWTI